jgi:hypothetical protein
MHYCGKYDDNRIPLSEVTRWEILRRSQREAPVRFQKKANYRAKDFNNVDFKDLFENNNFTWSSRVGDYIVTISFEGPFDLLQWQLKSMKGKNRWKRINHKMLVDCLSKALDTEDLFIDCRCPDFIYRYKYWATQADCNYGLPQNTAPKVRNVKNNKGYCCKHILAVLYGKRWVPAAAKAWLYFIRANPNLSEWYIWGTTLKDEEKEEQKELEDSEG